MSAGSPFNPRLMIGLIAAGIAAFAALMLLLAYGGGLGAPRGSGNHAESVAATGFKGLVTLVGSVHQTRIVRRANELGSDALLVATLDERTSKADVDRLLALRRGLPTLLVLPKWFTVADPSHRGWVRAIGPGMGAMAARSLGEGISVELNRRVDSDTGRFAYGSDILDRIAFPLPAATQSISGDALTPLAPIDRGRSLVAQLGEQPHYLLADPDLLNNHGLRDLGRARAALALIDALNMHDMDVVNFDMTLSGLAAGSAPNALRLAFEPPFLVLTLALFMAALLAGLHGAFRFGPVRREQRMIAFGKAALVENSAGLIRLAGREARLGGAYAEVVRQEAARAASAPSWLQGEELDAYLDRLGRGDGPDFSTLAARLDNAHGRHSLMSAARALFQWKKDIIP